jgi:hypothetical protein
LHDHHNEYTLAPEKMKVTENMTIWRKKYIKKRSNNPYGAYPSSPPFLVYCV